MQNIFTTQRPNPNIIVTEKYIWWVPMYQIHVNQEN